MSEGNFPATKRGDNDINKWSHMQMNTVRRGMMDSSGTSKGPESGALHYKYSIEVHF